MTTETPSATRPVALLVGATGLVGQQCLRLLTQDPAVGSVRVLVRRPMAVDSPKVQVCVADFDRLETHADWLAADWVFCALGTTIAKAGSRGAFRQVDFDYPLQVAQLAKAQGAKRFLLVSATGADAKSKVFYSRVKGELEEAIAAIGFESVTFARPSLLAGERDEVRIAERIGLKFGWLLPERYRPVQARQVAQGLVNAAKSGRPGVHGLTNLELRLN
ncbi:MAG: NAD(P)H-binding protein [Aquabacterium sp.]|uniref:NAD(P)H-binding protein n=1 Tax=Aquabacterium sp. TaxID=1872578 RepID=UPI00271AB079|nr:NAD(P)H-binding protein [Aquabacterium sp.]MDO9003148.1 NAD(P)H-binding protein [Aquabacterium sp.]